MTLIHAPEWTTRAVTVIAPPRRDDVVEEELDGEVILYDARTGNIHRLNETALEVWRQCDGQRTTRDIAAGLTETFDVDFDTALDHVEELVTVLAESNLVKLTEFFSCVVCNLKEPRALARAAAGG